VRELAADFAQLDEKLAEISRRQTEVDAFARRLDSMAAKLQDGGGHASEGDLAALAIQVEALSARVDHGGALAGNDLAQRMEALSHKLDRLSEKPRISVSSAPDGLDTLVHRLDQLDAKLAAGTAPHLKPIEELLHSLVEKVDAVERSEASGDALDALEKQVGILARRLERPTGDPALASFERTMSDLMSQMEMLRAGAQEVATETAKAVVAETLAALPKPDSSELSSVRRDLDELRTQQNAVDKRVQVTLENVHAALERMVMRLASIEGEVPAARAEPRVGDEGPRTTRVKAPVAAPRPETPPPAKPAPNGAAGEAETSPRSRLEDILLEPGAGRPRPDESVEPAGRVPETASDIKASFIAAARRAAQAAAEEAARTNSRKPGLRGEASVLAKVEGARANLAARMKGALDQHRRPILLGLAALVLTLGALQAVGLLGGSSTKTAEAPAPAAAAQTAAAPVVQAPAEPTREAAPAAAERVADPAPEAKAAEPKTTQAIPAAASGEPAPASALAPAALEGTVAPQFVGARPAFAKPDAKAAAAAAPVQIAPPAPAGTAEAESRGPALPRIAKLSSVGELPVSPALNGLRQAALGGDPVAVYDMASRLAEGRGYARDLQLAAKLFEKAAAAGLVPAQYRIGNHYEKGLGVPRDAAAAKSWYQRAADSGNARAMHNLAVLLAQGTDGKPDYAAAAEWFRRAAEHGIKDSQFNLAVLLARGLGVTANFAQSYTWFAAAAAQGDEDAAKKRDEIGGRLPAADLAAAKTAAETFRAKTPERAANEVAIPAQGWAEATPATNAPANSLRPSHGGKRV
jgi:localization factor PodJL